MSILAKATSLLKRKPKPHSAKASQPSRKATAGAARDEKKIESESTVATRIGLAPLMTEKGMRLQGKTQTAVFEVRRNASKQEIARAIFAQYGVKPLAIRTVNMRGKIRRRAKSEGTTSAWKKAYIKVDDVQKLSATP